jgi:two-component system OmpR family sensor kinase
MTTRSPCCCKCAPRRQGAAALARRPHHPVRCPLEAGVSQLHRTPHLHAVHPQDDLWLQLADPLGERAEVRSGTLTGLITVLLLMLPVLAGLIRHIARKELRSVQWLQQQITSAAAAICSPWCCRTCRWNCARWAKA